MIYCLFVIPTSELVVNLKCPCLCYKFLTTFYMSNEATFHEVNTVNKFVSKIVYVKFFFQMQEFVFLIVSAFKMDIYCILWHDGNSGFFSSLCNVSSKRVSNDFLCQNRLLHRVYLLESDKNADVGIKCQHSKLCEMVMITCLFFIYWN